MRRHLATCATLLLLALSPGLAQTPGPTAGQETAAAAFEALTEAERKAIQDDLVWTGDYLGVVDGAFGRRSREAFFAFDAKRDPAANGVPTPQKLKALAAAAERARKAAGFVVVSDATGARIGVPKALTPQASRAANASRHASRDGRIALDLAVVDGAEMDLPRLFERLKTESPNRRVTYKLARPGFVVVAGETPGRRFYTRFAQGEDAQGRATLRGFTFYTPADRADLERVTIAVANSFDPFPGAAVPEPPRLEPARPQVATVQPTAPAPTVSATAISLGGGRYLAALPADCLNIVLAEAPAKIVARGENGLTLLEGAARPPVQIAAAAASDGLEALALGFAAGQRGPASLMVASGRINAAGALVAGLQPGMAGAPVFDREGRFLGLARPFGAQRLVAGVAPAAPHALIGAREATGFAGLAASAPHAPGGAGELAQRHGAALVSVSCRR